MHVSRRRALCIEIFKTLEIEIPGFVMHSIFKVRSSAYSPRSPNNLKHYRSNQVTLAANSLQSFEPQVRNGLPIEIKSAKNLCSYKRMMKM